MYHKGMSGTSRNGRLTERRTYTIDEVYKLLGVSRNAAYNAARIDGAIAGVKVLRVGRRYLVPKAAFDRALSGDASE